MSDDALEPPVRTSLARRIAGLARDGAADAADRIARTLEDARLDPWEAAAALLDGLGTTWRRRVRTRAMYGSEVEEEFLDCMSGDFDLAWLPERLEATHAEDGRSVVYRAPTWRLLHAVLVDPARLEADLDATPAADEERRRAFVQALAAAGARVPRDAELHGEPLSFEWEGAPVQATWLRGSSGPAKTARKGYGRGTTIPAAFCCLEWQLAGSSLRLPLREKYDARRDVHYTPGDLLDAVRRALAPATRRPLDPAGFCRDLVELLGLPPENADHQSRSDRTLTLFRVPAVQGPLVYRVSEAMCKALPRLKRCARVSLEFEDADARGACCVLERERGAPERLGPFHTAGELLVALTAP